MQNAMNTNTEIEIPAILAALTSTPEVASTDLSIYVASLSDYNAGILHGRWISCCQDSDAIQEEIEEMLANSPYAARYGEIAEEWAIHDYDFCGLSLGESEDLEELAELAEALEEHGEPRPLTLSTLAPVMLPGAPWHP